MTAPIPRISLSEPDLRGNEAKYLKACVKDNWVSSAGHFIQDFERMIAAKSGSEHAVAVCNGTVAIKMALLACGVVSGDAVIVPDWTFIASANAVSDTGAKPIFVDVTQDTWTLDPALVAQAIAKYPNVMAIVAVHPLGYTCDMDALLDAAGDVPIIEDAAGALGATYGGRSAGGIGSFGCFSFNGNKMITAGAGGAVVTQDSEAARWLRHVTAQARVANDYTHDSPAFNYRMSNVNAAIGKAQMERFDEIQAIKHKIADAYRAVLSNDPQVRLKAMPNPQWGAGNDWLFSVLCETEASAESLIAHLDRHGIDSRKFWRALSSQPAYKDAEFISVGIAESLSGRVVSLPCSTGLSDDDLSRVTDAVEAFLAT